MEMWNEWNFWSYHQNPDIFWPASWNFYRGLWLIVPVRWGWQVYESSLHCMVIYLQSWELELLRSLKCLRMIVIIDMKSSKPALFICLGKDGKIKLPSSDDGSWSHNCHAGVCDPADVTATGTASPAGSATQPLLSRQSLLGHPLLPGRQTVSSRHPCWVGNHCLVISSCRVVTPCWVGNLYLVGRSCWVVHTCWLRRRLDDGNMVLRSSWSGTVEVKFISFLDPFVDPGWSVESASWHLEWCWEGRDLWLTIALDDCEGRDLWSTVDLEEWWWDSWDSIALDETHADRGWSIKSAPCLDLELDLTDEDNGRVRSPLSWRLGEWCLADSALGDPWRLDNPQWWSLWLQSSLCRRWWSDPLVLVGPSDREGRTTTNTLDDTVLLDFSWDCLDEVADLSFPAEPSFFRFDPSSFLLTGGAWSPSSGAWSLMESSMESCALFVAATALHFCWQPCQALPTLPGANHMEILSCIMSTHHWDDIVDSYDGCHCNDESASIPGTWVELLVKKIGHLVPPSCELDRQQTVTHKSWNKDVSKPKTASKSTQSWDRLTR